MPEIIFEGGHQISAAAVLAVRTKQTETGAVHSGRAQQTGLRPRGAAAAIPNQIRECQYRKMELNSQIVGADTWESNSDLTI